MRALLALLVVLASGTCTAQTPDNSNPPTTSAFPPLLGLYVGAGAGYAKTNQYFNSPEGGPSYFSGDRTGWKVLAGIRPLPWLGSELEYMDFGGAHKGPYSEEAYCNCSLSEYDQLYGVNGHVRAGTLFAVGYLPLPQSVSWFDVFAKVGVSFVSASDSYAGNFPNTYVNCPGTCAPLGQVSVSESTHNTGLAYGAGVQFHFGPLAVRGEYEGVNSKLGGNPYLTSLVLTWTL